MEKEFNPLISPCKCTGTISMIHLKCLKEWLDTHLSAIVEAKVQSEVERISRRRVY